MTAAKLHSLPPHREPYTGGFTTSDGGCHFQVAEDAPEGTVDFTMRVQSRGFGSAWAYHRLSRAEALELAGALEKAAKA